MKTKKSKKFTKRRTSKKKNKLKRKHGSIKKTIQKQTIAIPLIIGGLAGVLGVGAYLYNKNKKSEKAKKENNSEIFKIEIYGVNILKINNIENILKLYKTVYWENSSEGGVLLSNDGKTVLKELNLDSVKYNLLYNFKKIIPNIENIYTVNEKIYYLISEKYEGTSREYFRGIAQYNYNINEIVKISEDYSTILKTMNETGIVCKDLKLDNFVYKKHNNTIDIKLIDVENNHCGTECSKSFDLLDNCNYIGDITTIMCMILEGVFFPDEYKVNDRRELYIFKSGMEKHLEDSKQLVKPLIDLINSENISEEYFETYGYTSSFSSYCKYLKGFVTHYKTEDQTLTELHYLNVLKNLGIYQMFKFKKDFDEKKYYNDLNIRKQNTIKSLSNLKFTF